VKPLCRLCETLWLKPLTFLAIEIVRDPAYHKYRDTIYMELSDQMPISNEPDYQALAEFRHQIRRFLHFSEQAARAAGLEPRQHQLMLALKGLPPNIRPRIGELASRLQIEHHSTVELVNRLSAGGFVRRHRDARDRREVLLSLTPHGEKLLRQLSVHHKSELRVMGPKLLRALKLVMSHTKNASRENSKASKKRVLNPNVRS
jgi:DNA-binding MarR family transcriptional regulator